MRAHAGSSQSDVISRQRWACLSLSVSTCFFIADSLVVTWNFRPFFRSSLRRAGLVAFGRLVVDTSGELSCGNERIIGATVRSVRAVESLYVTVYGSAACIGALVPCQGVAWVQKRSDASQKTSVKTGILWWWILKVSQAQSW